MTLPDARSLPHGLAQLQTGRSGVADEGKNLTVDHRALDDPRGPFVAATDLIRLQPDLVVALGPEIALQAVLNASPTIQIVMVAINFDPLEWGHIASLARPGSNITGLIYRQPELASKQVELLTQAFPGRTRLAILWDEQTQDLFTAAERAAKSLSIELREKKLEQPPYDFLPVFRDPAISAADMLLVRACVDRTFVNPNSSRRRPEKIRGRRTVQVSRVRGRAVEEARG